MMSIINSSSFLSSYLLNGVHMGSNFNDYVYVATRGVTPPAVSLVLRIAVAILGHV